MSCYITMDLCPKDSTFSLSKSGKSATLLCSFSGKYKSENHIDIDLVLTSRSGFGSVKEQVAELEQKIAAGSLLRVSGMLQRMLYQDRDSGEEIDRLRVYAFDIAPSAEKEAIFSSVFMEGGVRKLSDTEIFKDLGSYRKAAFFLFADPTSEFDRETYLNVYCTGYGEVADKVNRLNLKDKSHVIAHGKLEATTFGVVGLRLFDLNYAHSAEKRKEISHESKQH